MMEGWEGFVMNSLFVLHSFATESTEFFEWFLHDFCGGQFHQVL